MSLPQQSWTVSCRACDLVIGAVEDGRFLHDEACTEPLAIGTGQLRCCRCGGRLVGEARAVAAPTHSDDEEIAVSLLRFRRPDLHAGEVRQRL
jgi:hypothetical protein